MPWLELFMERPVGASLPASVCSIPALELPYSLALSSPEAPEERS